MTAYLSKYFFVTGVQMNSDNTTDVSLIGYFTDRSHTMFLPPNKISRLEAINMIDSGYVLFIETNQGKQKLLKNVEIFGKYYLRMEYEELACDEKDILGSGL